MAENSSVCTGRKQRTRLREALKKLQELWGTTYSRIVTRWETKAHALLAFMRHPWPIRRYLYTTNQPERLAKEVKRRTKVADSLGGSAREIAVLGAQPPERAPGKASATRLCGSGNGKLPCRPDTLDKALWPEGSQSLAQF